MPSLVPSDQRDQLISLLGQLVAPLAQALPGTTEVVLHDLSRLPNSIVAISGEVTGRRVGDPATDVLLRHLRSGDRRPLVGYRTELPGGREGRSTTVIVRLETGEPLAALCVNADVTDWLKTRALLDGLLAEGGRDLGTGHEPQHAGSGTGRQAKPQALMTAEQDGKVSPPNQDLTRVPGGELFARSVDELANAMISEAIAAIDVPVELMKKRHKLEIVAELERRGLFMLRDAVEMASAALHVTRYTIYNYLNELSAERESLSDPNRAVT